MHLCNIKDVRCCIEMVLMFVNVSCSADLLIFNVFLRISNDKIWVQLLLG